MKLFKKLLCKLFGHKLSYSQLWWDQLNPYQFKPAFYGKYCYRCETAFEEPMPQKIKDALSKATPEEILDRFDIMLYFKRW